MKTSFILALLTLTETNTVAQLDTTCSQGSGQSQQQQQPWQQWRQQMDPSVEFLRGQCNTMTLPFVQSRMWQLSSCHIMRHQCCQQLAHIPEQFRCQTIHIVSQAITRPQPQPQPQAPLEIMKMSLQTLPSMCNVYVPAYCNRHDIPMARCSGGRFCQSM
ncbi:avenin-like b3 [Hordeum vulgare subsp. vulgare]|uniref:Bifunctional inhibitor/plant lipid transfer protein/seed storage helical domain-containing protein n=1 Tax=Hordeum vulgare subsp. vulgare TaxID=112509 RepID=A0A8I6Z060_HORVV|nr:avenin-like b3 [Hordeum vulgare subsp. vulgare]